MAVDQVYDLKNCIESVSKDRSIIFCIERKEAPPLIDVVRSLAGKPLAILIGPEGGFSEDEINYIMKINNIHPASLGPRVLRAETALITALSVAQLLYS